MNSEATRILQADIHTLEQRISAFEARITAALAKESEHTRVHIEALNRGLLQAAAAGEWTSAYLERTAAETCDAKVAAVTAHKLAEKAAAEAGALAGKAAAFRTAIIGAIPGTATGIAALIAALTK